MASETQKDLPTGNSGSSEAGSKGEGTVQDENRRGAAAQSGSTSETEKQQRDEAHRDVRSEERRQAAASKVENLAGALRGAAGSAGSASPTAQIAQGAADTLERISQILRSKEADTMVRDLESMARQQPALLLGAAVAVGFLAIRVLKSGGDTGGERHAAAAPLPRAEPSPAWMIH